MTYKKYKEALKHNLTNVIELKHESTIRKALNHNGYEYIQYLVNIVDTDIRNLCYQATTKKIKYLSIGHQNLIRSFIDYFEYRTYYNDHNGDDWTNITNNNFNYFCMKDYYNIIILREYGLVNPR